MKNRVNITIDEKLVRDGKRYAARNKISLSQLIENFLKQVTRKKSDKKNILELLGEIPEPRKIKSSPSKETYYEETKGKYGF